VSSVSVPRLVGYYEHFIRDFDSIAAPLTKLLCRERFKWTPEADVMFRALQWALMMAPILRLPAFNKEFVVKCDASGTGISTVLHQGEGVIAFFRRQMGLVPVVSHWRQQRSSFTRIMLA
jgi:hypothetical protein